MFHCCAFHPINTFRRNVLQKNSQLHVKTSISKFPWVITASQNRTNKMKMLKNTNLHWAAWVLAHNGAFTYVQSLKLRGSVWNRNTQKICDKCLFLSGNINTDTHAAGWVVSKTYVAIIPAVSHKDSKGTFTCRVLSAKFSKKLSVLRRKQ